MNAQITRYLKWDQGDMDLTITGDNPIYVHYGSTTQGSGYASAVDYNLEYTKLSEVLNDDNSITIQLRFVISEWVRTPNGSAGFPAQIYGAFDEKVIWDFLDTTDSSKRAPGDTITKTYTIAPEDTVNAASSLYYWNTAMGFSNKFWIGINIYNPNPPRYIPMKGKKGGTYKSFNSFNLQGEKGGAYKTLWNYYGDTSRSQGLGKENNSYKRLEKE